MEASGDRSLQNRARKSMLERTSCKLDKERNDLKIEL